MINIDNEAIVSTDSRLARMSSVDRRSVLQGLALSVIGMATAIPIDGAQADVWINHDLSDPDHLVLVNRLYGVRILDAKGEFLASRGAYYGPPVSYAKMPKHLINALITQEDRRFYDHDGIDIIAMGRAFKEDVTSFSLKQGGSTITQQVLKDVFFRDDVPIERKFKEILNAWDLEQHLTKERILFLYLNRVLFGGSARGIEAAARVFFNKYAVKLTVMEAAMLIIALPAPNARNPRRDYQGSIRRAQHLIDTMVELKRLPKTVAQTAKRERPLLAPGLEAWGGYHRDSVQVGWFAKWTEGQTKKRAPFAEGITTIRTTLNQNLQRIVERIIMNAVRDNGRRQGFDQAVAIVLSHYGDILAMVGGYDFRAMAYDIATQARRQPGSAFKPIVYLTALERGIRASDKVNDDMPLILRSRTIHNIDREYRGAITLEEALAFSSNVASARLAQGHILEIKEVAGRLGVKSPLANDIGIALGESETGILELTAAYATFANGGWLAVPSAISEIKDNFNDVIPRPPSVSKRVIKREHAETMQRMLTSVVRYGTGQRAQAGFWAAGKTGTTDDYRDAWFIGFTNRFVASVWIGNRDSSPTKNVSGGSLPAHIWRDIMVEAHRLSLGHLHASHLSLVR